MSGHSEHTELVATCPECAQEAAKSGFRGDPQPSKTCPTCGQSIPGEVTVRATETAQPDAASTEALIGGQRSVSDVKELVRKALKERIKGATGVEYVWVSIVDMTCGDGGGEVVYACDDDALHQSSYSVADDGAITLGEPVLVSPAYVPTPGLPADSGVAAESATEMRVQLPDGQVVEAKGKAADGGRIFRVRVIAYGDSANRRRYPETVMRAAAPIYEGAKAYDHHRTEAEMSTGTITGLVGYYRGVTAEADGLYGDLHLLPSASHTAEALDASLAGQTEGLEPLVGISHDVYAMFRTVTEGGQQLQEATAIKKVNSADVVADPAAGGQATRMVAGGVDPTQKSDTEPNEPAGNPPSGPSTREPDVTTPATEALLAALQNATPEQLAAVGLSKVEKAPETTTPIKEAKPERSAEVAKLGKTEFLGKLLIKQKVADAGLPEAVVESLTESLPDRIAEADVDAQVASLKSVLGIAERAKLVPTVPTVDVVRESVEKKVAALDAFFQGKFSEGYRSFRQAFADFTGHRPRSWDDDVNRQILRESIRSYDSADRAVESLDSTSWAQVLGDSITRRMAAEYGHPSLQSWRMLVSSTPPINDFRTQRIGRVGGYGVLPAVNQGAPYQPLTSPGDEEATYAITKRGGTEDLTLEMIANDDVRAISNIPRKLGLAAAQTLYRFVWDILPTNAATTYDSTALFHADHANTDSSAGLAQSTLSTGRRKMREQTAYGDSSDVLSIVPKLLVVPPELEEIAFQISTSAVAIPSSGNASDIPNLHQNLRVEVVDYYTDANDWFLIADTGMVPTIEIGFYQGREDPELFTQADPNVGSMFDADKVTYKIRHIYSGTVLDHRGFYRGVG